jgi:hypothetical protein
VLAALCCTAALFAAACSGDGSSSEGGTGTDQTVASGGAWDDLASEEMTTFADPAAAVEVSVGDDFGLLLPAPPDDIRWVLTPRPDIAYVIARGADHLPDDTTFGEGTGAVLFDFGALGAGSLTLSFTEVKGTFGEAVPDARTVTYTVHIAGDPALTGTTSASPPSTSTS